MVARGIGGKTGAFKSPCGEEPTPAGTAQIQLAAPAREDPMGQPLLMRQALRPSNRPYTQSHEDHLGKARTRIGAAV